MNKVLQVEVMWDGSIVGCPAGVISIKSSKKG